MEQSLNQMKYFSDKLNDQLRLLTPFNRLIYLCNQATKYEDDGNAESCVLGMKAGEIIYFLRETYSLNEYKEIIKNQTSLINRSDELITGSPLLIGLETWKEIIKYEISIIPTNQRQQEIKRIIGCIKDLSFRIDNEYIFSVFDELLSLDLVSNYSDSEIESEWSTFEPASEIDLESYNDFPVNEFLDENNRFCMDSLSKGKFVIPIDTYVDFARSIDLNTLKRENPDKLIKRIEELEIRTNKKRKNKITLKKKVKPVIKGLTYLLSKNNKNKDHDILSEFSTNFIYAIFDSGESHLITYPNEIDFPNELIVDYLIFLEKYGYFQNDSSISIPKILEKQIWYDMKGKSKQTFYRLFKQKLPNPKKIHETKIYFGGLTSEIALKNEMINEN